MYKVRNLLLLFILFSSPIIAMGKKKKSAKKQSAKVSGSYKGDKETAKPTIETELTVGQHSAEISFQRYRTTNPDTNQYIETEITYEPNQPTRIRFSSAKSANLDPEIKRLIAYQVLHQQHMHQDFINNLAQRIRDAGSKTDIDLAFKNLCSKAISTRVVEKKENKDS
jgi:hypothetical protein